MTTKKTMPLGMLRERVIQLAAKRVVEGDAEGRTDADYSSLVRKLATRTRQRPSTVRAWARRHARADARTH